MDEDGGRSPVALGWAWASRISSLGLSFAIPPLLGAWIDQRLGSGPIGVLAGMVLGFVAGMARILAIARGGNESPRS